MSPQAHITIPLENTPLILRGKGGEGRGGGRIEEGRRGGRRGEGRGGVRIGERRGRGRRGEGKREERGGEDGRVATT